MKKILNTPDSAVRDMCAGIAAAHPSLELLPGSMVIKRRHADPGKVSLISGGGSGHEPAHAGFVGKGMLDAAVCGNVFASPSQIQVYQAIKSTASQKGTLLIIKNYSGDMMNFQNGALLAQEDGLQVAYVKVDDDIAVEDSLYTVGRRGVAGTVFVHKLAGAAAESGACLDEVRRIAQKAAEHVRSIGFALSSCTVPAKGTPTFTLDDGEMEYGVGIHGEPGIRREPVTDARTLAQRMTASISGELSLTAGSRAAVLVNGFGATPLMELYLMYYEVARALDAKGITVVRALVGNYMTSLDMAGASLSILKTDEELESLLSAPCDTPALRVDGPIEIVPYQDYFAKASEENVCFEVETPAEYGVVGRELTLNNLHFIVDTMSDCIIRNETPFCELDAHAGDGDFGMSVAKGFRELKRHWKDLLAEDDIGSFLTACSMIISEHCGGASGPIWGAAFRAAGKETKGSAALGVAQTAALLQAAVRGIQVTGERSFGRGAGVGDKTLMDALIPCADTWTALAGQSAGFREAFHEGARTAREGAKSTEAIVARMGRAGTVGERSLGYPDAGAHALGVIFTQIAQSLEFTEKP